jgi:hypothetical protein
MKAYSLDLRQKILRAWMRRSRRLCPPSQQAMHMVAFDIVAMPYSSLKTALGDGEGTGWWWVGAELEGIVKVGRGVMRIARGGQ